MLGLKIKFVINSFLFFSFRFSGKPQFKPSLQMMSMKMSLRVIRQQFKTLILSAAILQCKTIMSKLIHRQKNHWVQNRRTKMMKRENRATLAMIKKRRTKMLHLKVQRLRRKKPPVENVPPVVNRLLENHREVPSTSHISIKLLIFSKHILGFATGKKNLPNGREIKFRKFFSFLY